MSPLQRKSYHEHVVGKDLLILSLDTGHLASISTSVS